MKKDTVIFDLDGTLLNTLDGLHAGFNYAIKRYGYKERTLDEIKGFVGNGVEKALERALPIGISKDEFNKIINVFKEYYQVHMFELTKPYDGIIDLLCTLKEKGYKTAVVSNKYDKAVKDLCKYFFDGLIDTAIGENTDIKRKPNPAGILKAIKELNSSKEKSIYIGDSDVDIQTAQNAEIPCISVLWGYRDENFLRAHGARFFAASPVDIFKKIENNLGFQRNF